MCKHLKTNFGQIYVIGCSHWVKFTKICKPPVFIFIRPTQTLRNMMRKFLQFLFPAALTLNLCTGLHTAAQNMNENLLNDTVDVVSYSINLSVVNLSSQQIQGMTEVRFTTPLSNISYLPLALKQLQVDSVKTDSYGPLNYTHTADLLHIQLGQPISAGDTSLVRIYYHGVPFHESWGGFHFSGSYAFNLGVGFESIPHNLGKAWFPCNDNFTDRAFYEYRIRVENDKLAVCGGLLRSVSSMCDGTKEFYWKSDRSLPTYLASVAVGPYVMLSDTFPGTEQDVPITWFVRPQDTARVNGSFQNLKEITHIYETCFGPYPFQRIGFTGTALGAMEHAENIAYPNGSINGGLSDEWLYAHELSHMWFGNKVTCSSDADMWLNEGWARWCETLYREHLYGEVQARGNMRSLAREVLRYAHISEGGYLPLSPMPSNLTYGTHVYDKGGMVTHALRGYLGDSLFFNGIRAYLDEYAYQPASSYDLRDFLSQYTNTDLTGFFDFHVFGPGFNHVSVDSFHVTPAGSHFDVEVFVRQKLKGAVIPAENCRSELSFMSHDRIVETHTITFSGWQGSSVFQLPFSPALVMADLYERNGDATTDNYQTIRATGLYDFPDTYFKMDVINPGDSAFARVTHHWVAPDGMLEPLPGLTLSDYRYWSVEGIFAEGFQATGRFTYNRGNALDNTLITSSADSLVILFRPGAGHEWQSVPFSRQGPWQLGIIYVPNLRPGEYTLAIWDELFVNAGDQEPGNVSLLKIIPNPAADQTEILLNRPETGRLTIHDSTGRTVYHKEVSTGDKSIRVNISGFINGNYLVNFVSRQGARHAARLIIAR